MTTSGRPGRVRRWVGWVLSGLIVLFFVFNGASNLAKPEEPNPQSDHLEWPPDRSHVLGVLMAGCAAVYAIPPTAVLGAILLTGYLGGACAAHVRVHDGPDMFMASVVFGVLAWVALALRDPRVFWLAFARK